MSTTTRAELSESNKWWISKHRYYELRHFCLQYPEWKKQLQDIDGLVGSIRQDRVNEGKTGDPTYAFAQARIFYSQRMKLVEDAAYEACSHQFWYMFLVKAVSEGKSYDILEAEHSIMPISRAEWYTLYRKFFWLLDKKRG